MYIEVKDKNTKYQIYLCHSEKVNGKSKKPLNKYLCSIDKEKFKYIEHDNNDKEEAARDILRGVQDKINKKTKKYLKKYLVSYNTLFK